MKRQKCSANVMKLPSMNRLKMKATLKELNAADDLHNTLEFHWFILVEDPIWTVFLSVWVDKHSVNWHEIQWFLMCIFITYSSRKPSKTPIRSLRLHLKDRENTERMRNEHFSIIWLWILMSIQLLYCSPFLYWQTFDTIKINIQFDLMKWEFNSVPSLGFKMNLHCLNSLCVLVCFCFLFYLMLIWHWMQFLSLKIKTLTDYKMDERLVISCQRQQLVSVAVSGYFPDACLVSFRVLRFDRCSVSILS